MPQYTPGLPYPDMQEDPAYAESTLPPTEVVTPPVNRRQELLDMLMARAKAPVDTAALAAEQESERQRQMALGIIEGTTHISKGFMGAASPTDMTSAKEASRAQLNNYLAQKKAERDQSDASFKSLQEMADLEGKGQDAAQRQANWEKEMKLKERELRQKPRTASSPFDKALETQLAKDYAKLQDNADQAAGNEEIISRTYDAFENYSKNKMGGTGGLATLGGLTKYGSEDTQALDTMFKDLSMTKMVNMFQGMSKAVDSNAERAAFNATNPSITSDDKVNRERLIGLKAINKRNQLEAEAQRNWVQSGGSLKNYQSPNRNLTSVVDASGNIQLVEKGKDLPEGLMPIDVYVKQGPGAAPQSTTSFLPPDKEKRKQELLAKQAASKLK